MGGACHATDCGPPTTGPAGPSMANVFAMDGPTGQFMAAMDGLAGLSTAPQVALLTPNFNSSG